MRRLGDGLTLHSQTSRTLWQFWPIGRKLLSVLHLGSPSFVRAQAKVTSTQMNRHHITFVLGNGILAFTFWGTSGSWELHRVTLMVNMGTKKPELGIVLGDSLVGRVLVRQQWGPTFVNQHPHIMSVALAHSGNPYSWEYPNHTKTQLRKIITDQSSSWTLIQKYSIKYW